VFAKEMDFMIEKENTIADKIKVLQTKIQVERDPVAKQTLNKQLRVLQLKQEIEQIRKRIEQLG
jgi:predicted transcriptional regulator